MHGPVDGGVGPELGGVDGGPWPLGGGLGGVLVEFVGGAWPLGGGLGGGVGLPVVGPGLGGVAVEVEGGPWPLGGGLGGGVGPRVVGPGLGGVVGGEPADMRSTISSEQHARFPHVLTSEHGKHAQSILSCLIAALRGGIWMRRLR